MAEGRGLDDYASPILRCAVFRRLNPGCQISYSVIPIGEAFPDGHYKYEGKATEAVRCEIVLADGSYIVAHKEIDKVDRGRDVPQTPEQMAKDETKCLGRAMRDGGIPQRLSELKELMRWIASMDGPASTNLAAVPASTKLNGPLQASTNLTDQASTNLNDAEDDDHPDAGAEDPTPEQLLASRFSRLNGADKAAFAKWAREAYEISNVMRAGDAAETLIGHLDKSDWQDVRSGLVVALETAAQADAEAAPPQLPPDEEPPF